jgi:hypothetical protein
MYDSRAQCTMRCGFPVSRAIAVRRALADSADVSRAGGLILFDRIQESARIAVIERGGERIRKSGRHYADRQRLARTAGGLALRAISSRASCPSS